MKKVLILMFVAFFAACSGEKEVENSGVFIEQKLNEFISQNPDWANDETINEEITDKFKRQAIKWSNEPDFLKGMPLQLERIVDTTESGQAVKMAHFKTFNDKVRPEGSLLNYVNLQIKGIVSDEQADQLKVENKYFLTGNLQRQGKRADVKFVKVSDFKGYDIGSYTFLITGFKPL
ncbi:hypothetical protein [Pedobacter cryotolerans]|uniref:Uncharacterized protein n=1 Tax=Pedobacter cryotolerans TaxID=2571270 RepID=A0A4U1C3V4_9SPHI|nr:hypothetical protein [Pedobacter cryotolerans]TKB99859.1 hypothetical protein FA045_10450 [Pedobacter cryotolerans]